MYRNEESTPYTLYKQHNFPHSLFLILLSRECGMRKAHYKVPDKYLHVAVSWYTATALYHCKKGIQCVALASGLFRCLNELFQTDTHHLGSWLRACVHLTQSFSMSKIMHHQCVSAFSDHQWWAKGDGKCNSFFTAIYESSDQFILHINSLFLLVV